MHVRRVGNKPTHLLAQYARDLNSYVIWVEENPIIIESALTHDVLNYLHLNKVTCLFIKKIIIIVILLNGLTSNYVIFCLKHNFFLFYIYIYIYIFFF